MFRLIPILLGIAITILAPLAHAHEIRPAVSDLYLENGRFRLEITVNLEAVIADIGTQVQDTSESQNAAEYDRLRAMTPAQLDAAFDREAFARNITFLRGTTAGHVQVQRVDIPPAGDLDLVRDSLVVVTGEFGDAPDIRLGWAAGYGQLVIRLIDEDNPYNAFLTAGDLSDPISTTGATAVSFGGALLDYIFVGFDHILPKGLDHILFVVGLFLLSTRLRPLLTQITAFTLAHSVTLALGILGIITVPASIVEPMIAISIMYVAIENIFTDHLNPWRPVVVFAFGLLHGLGFAGVLTEFGLAGTVLVPGLIGFNLGVELGQLTVILICFGLVGFWFSRRDWYRRVITIPASMVIALIAAYWTVERIFFV